MNPEPESTPTESNVSRQSGQIIKNVLVNWTAFLVTLLTGFWMSPFLIRELGESKYGVWVLTGSLAGYLGLLDLGITPTIVKYIAEHKAKGDQEAINRIATTSGVIFSAAGLFAVALSVAFAPFFNRVFHTNIGDSEAFWTVCLVGLNIALSFPSSVVFGILRGYQRYDVFASATAVTILIRSGFIVYAINHGHGLIVLAALTLGFDLIRLLYATVRVYMIDPNIRIAPRYYRKEELTKLLGHGTWIFLIMVADQLNLYTDAVVIGRFLPVAYITTYSIGFRLVGYLRSLVVEMVGVLMPAVSGLHAQEDREGVGNLLATAAKFTLLLALPPAAVFCLLGEQFITLWVGEGYEQSAVLLSILTVGIVAHLCEYTVYTFLIGTGRANIVARFAIAQSVLNLVLSLILIKPFGLVGVAMGTAVSMTGFAFVSIPTYFRLLKLPLLPFVRRALLPPLWAQIPWLIGVFLLRKFVHFPNMPLFFGALLLTLPPYAAMMYFAALNPSERSAFGALGAKFGLKSRPVPSDVQSAS